MLTLIGVILIVVGVSDLVAAAFIARQGTPDASGLGGTASTPPVVKLLRAMGFGTIVAGVVLLAAGLLS